MPPEGGVGMGRMTKHAWVREASSLIRVDVDTTRRAVYLSGTVETPAQTATAEQLAWHTKGVKSVVDTLHVQPS